MDTDLFSGRTKWLLFGGAAIIVIAAVVFMGKSSTAPEAPVSVVEQNGDQQAAPAANEATSGTTAQNPTAPKQPKTTYTSPATQTPGPVVSLGVSFVTPAKGDVWAINENHPIIWNKATGLSGGIYLLDEKTGKTVGWVVPSTGSSQYSYAWDTRDVSVDRIGGNRVNLTPGTYSLHLVATGKSGTESSAVFTIVDQGGAQQLTSVVRLEKSKVTPNVITLAKGARIAFINNETKGQKVTGDGFAAFTVPANGGTATLDTSALSAGIYSYTTDLYTYLSPGSFTVK